MATLRVTTQRRGGKKLQRLLREAGKGGVSGVKVGFFSTARYEDGTPVAAVAAWNEFGTETIPERPFFRNALAESERSVGRILQAGLNTKKMVVDEQLAGRVGAHVQGKIQDSITSLKEPPNSPATIAQKRKKLHGKKGTGGGETPLIDTGVMLHAVAWEVEQ